MKMFTKLFLSLALLVVGVGGANATKLYATYGTPAEQGSWNAETGVYSWTQSYSNLMTIFNFGNGELANYKSLHLTTSGYKDTYRVCFMNGGNALATIAFYSEGQKDLVFAERDETKNLDLSQITHISFGGSSDNGSITITKKPYLQKPMELIWGDDGNAEIDLTDLTASGGFTLNDQTGELTGTGEAGSLSVNFPTEGVDLTNLTGFSVTYTGDNLFNNFEIGDGTTNKGFWSSVTGREDLNQYMTEEYVGAPAAITNWKWINNSTVGTMTITSIKLKASVIKANPGGEKAIETLQRKYYEDGEWKTGAISSSYGSNIGTPIGDGNATQDEFIDLSSYKEIRLYVSKGDVRIFVVKEDNFNTTADGYILTKDGVKQNGQWNGIQDTDHKLTKKGDYYYITISDLKAACGGQAKLIGVKAEYGQTVDISKIVVVEDSEYNYSISGSGALASSTLNALADANATSIDATGITAPTTLPTENPNCLITANAGMVTNTNNVIVNNVCANLVLTDKMPFKAPVAFTATKAKFTKTVSDADYATMVLPFAVETLPNGVEAYNITGNEGDVLTTAEAETIEANKPVMLKNAGTYEFTASNAAIAATATGVQTNDLLNGAYAATAVPTDNTYVLQKQSGDVNFYKAVAGLTIDPFRAYLTTATAGARLSFDFDQTTGIKTVETAKDVNVYNLQGVRVANPTKGLYIVNGKKAIVK